MKKEPVGPSYEPPSLTIIPIISKAELRSNKDHFAIEKEHPTIVSEIIT